jgi:putative transposase
MPCDALYSFFLRGQSPFLNHGSILRRLACMRKPRALQIGARYHVTSRGNNKTMVLGSDTCKDLFSEVLARAKKRFRFEVENYCIMGNHFHIIIRPGENENLSRIMQWILSVFAMAYHRIFGTSGHVWGGRFFSAIIQNFRELLRVFGYIDSNPLAAGLVSAVEEWEFGGLSHRRAGKRTILGRLSMLLLSFFPKHWQIMISDNT